MALFVDTGTALSTISFISSVDSSPDVVFSFCTIFCPRNLHSREKFYAESDNCCIHFHIRSNVVDRPERYRESELVLPKHTGNCAAITDCISTSNLLSITLSYSYENQHFVTLLTTFTCSSMLIHNKAVRPFCLSIGLWILSK